MIFKVHTSSITSLLTTNVYSQATNWGTYSSNVNVGIAFEVPGMPESSFKAHIYGSSNMDPGVLGSTKGYNSNGFATGLGTNWASVTIIINTASSAFSGAESPSIAAKKTVIHEVGHCLKLAHPNCDENMDGHIYYGYPCAIMNQGYPDGYAVSAVIASHDILNLTDKWGE